MKWSHYAMAAVFVLATPARAEDKGAVLVQHWLAQIGQIQPIVAETTTTYTYGLRREAA